MGKNLGRFLFIAVALQFFLTGCWRFGVDELHDTTPQGTPFQNSLADFYLKFAESEADQYDWTDADYFARKGIRAATGEDVEPEDPRDWKIPETMITTVEEARKILLKAVDARTKNVEPETAALAYFLFDCWIEQQEENWQVEHIESCRSDFFETIDYLSVAVDRIANDEINLDIDPSIFEVVKRKETNNVRAQTLDPQAILEEVLPQETREAQKTSYVIFFEFDSAEINKGGHEIIKRVIKELEQVPEYLVRLNGYADRAGNEEYNQQLSKLRAMAVKSELVTRGVVEDSIEIHSFGETKPQKQTKDGIREESNRIVEIFIH